MSSERAGAAEEEEEEEEEEEAEEEDEEDEKAEADVRDPSVAVEKAAAARASLLSTTPATFLGDDILWSCFGVGLDQSGSRDCSLR